jgi:hypothetical protein
MLREYLVIMTVNGWLGFFMVAGCGWDGDDPAEICPCSSTLENFYG